MGKYTFSVQGWDIFMMLGLYVVLAVLRYSPRCALHFVSVLNLYIVHITSAFLVAVSQQWHMLPKLQNVLFFLNMTSNFSSHIAVHSLINSASVNVFFRFSMKGAVVALLCQCRFIHSRNRLLVWCWHVGRFVFKIWCLRVGQF